MRTSTITHQQQQQQQWSSITCFQTCLAEAVSFADIGTHTAKPVKMTVFPAQVDTGIVFIRKDVTSKPNVIPALWNYVSDTMFCTKITNEAGVSVSTIEHIMAALYACDIDNALIEIDGEEVPIMDGSSDQFIAPLLRAGVMQLSTPRRAIKIVSPVIVREGEDRWVSISPNDELFFDCEFHFSGRADFETQRYTGAMTPEVFREDIARARTFGFVEDVIKLRSMGLVQGSSLENAIGIQDGKVLNPEGLRFKDEFVRHKILDAVGDLYTAGCPIRGYIRGARTGHSMMNQLLRAVFSDQRFWRYV